MRTNRFIKFIVIVLLTIVLSSCKKNEVEGIIIGSDLLYTQSYSQNKEFCKIIKGTLNKNPNALAELIDFNCGGATGCYDLGYVLTQIVNKIGEEEFIKLIDGFTNYQKGQIFSLISAGLEYGDNNYDGKMDNQTINDVYPKLAKIVEYY